MTDRPFDLNALRLSQDFPELASTKKLVTTVPVRKPDKLEFIRVHRDPTYRLDRVALLEFKAEQELYLVHPQVYHLVAAEAKEKALFLAVNRQAVPFIWPVPLPGSDGRTNRWNASALDAAVRAQTTWVRVVSNMALGAYEVSVPIMALPEAEFPDMSFEDLVQIAFKDRIIESPDHPALRRLRGEV